MIGHSNHSFHHRIDEINPNNDIFPNEFSSSRPWLKIEGCDDINGHQIQKKKSQSSCNST